MQTNSGCHRKVRGRLQACQPVPSDASCLHRPPVEPISTFHSCGGISCWFGTRIQSVEDLYRVLHDPRQVPTRLQQLGQLSCSRHHLVPSLFDADQIPTPGHPQFYPGFSYVPSEIPQSLDLQRLVSVVEPWLKGCDDGHPACQQTSHTVPRRLIELTNSLRLVEVHIDQHPDCGGQPQLRYATLSHCWGHSTSTLPKTLSTNIQQRMITISREELPQKFCDAIDIARALGCGYIWIDCLCIIQDSKQDWKEQSVLMGEVYSNAYFNIMASSLPDSRGRLFRDRNYYATTARVTKYGATTTPPIKDSFRLPLSTYTHWIQNEESVPCPVTIRYALDRAHCYVYDKVEHGHREEALLGRAWVFQEKLLSRRNLYITSSEMIWECRSCLSCECGEIAKPSPQFGPLNALYIRHSHGGLCVSHLAFTGHHVPTSRKATFADVCSSRRPIQEALGFWRSLLSEYSLLGLTYDTDRDIALSGIRQAFNKDGRFQYYAGLWIQDLPESLLWTKSSRDDDEWKNLFNAPSWSWISRDKGNHALVDWSYHVAGQFEKGDSTATHG